MLMGKVTGSVWATRKHQQLEGKKFMTVRILDADRQESGEVMIAVDVVGAGVGETVLITTGSGARAAFGGENPPVDAAIVGIIDINEVTKARM